MGIMTNFVGCDCLRKDEDLTEHNPNKNKESKISLMSQQTTSVDDEILTYVKSQTMNSQYFDGKIDVKDYIQQLDKDSLENYEKIQRIGKGSYSSVYKVRNKNTNLIRAMKIIPKNFQKDNAEIMREIEILKNLDHPNVMKIYEFLEDDKNYYLIEEFCDEGDLETALDNKKIYCEFLVKFIMYQVFLAVNYLHSNNIVHQDIKKKNISIIKLGVEKEDNKENQQFKEKKLKRLKSEKLTFLNPLKNNDDIFIKINEDKEIQEEFNTKKLIRNLSKKAKEQLYELSKRSVKVIDFGEAIFMPQKKKNIEDIAGTLNYLSPEIIKGQMIKELDEWACGVLMYYLLSAKFPFDGKTEEEIFYNIENQELNLNIPELENISDDCKDLISKLLERDANKRIKAKKALEHSFFKTGIKMKKIVGGMENKQTEKVLNEWIKLQNTHRQSNAGIFKKAVLAYMALNFVEKEEEKKMKNLFYKLSGGNRNFLITKENFALTIKQVSDNYTDEEIDKLFDKLDDNKSGIIEYEELVRGFSDREKLLNEKNMRQAFNFFDKDKNGTISWEEISNVVFKNKKMPKIFMSQFLEEISSESGKDVNITFEDFCKIIKK
jgi:calcium-dependent protein kinase